jgi:hypothetical protein
MTDLDVIKAMLDNVGTGFEINSPHYSQRGLDILSGSENYAVAMFTFDSTGTLVGFEIES